MIYATTWMIHWCLNLHVLFNYYWLIKSIWIHFKQLNFDFDFHVQKLWIYCSFASGVAVVAGNVVVCVAINGNNWRLEYFFFIDRWYAPIATVDNSIILNITMIISNKTVIVPNMSGRSCRITSFFIDAAASDVMFVTKLWWFPGDGLNTKYVEIPVISAVTPMTVNVTNTIFIN